MRIVLTVLPLLGQLLFSTPARAERAFARTLGSEESRARDCTAGQVPKNGGCVNLPVGALAPKCPSTIADGNGGCAPPAPGAAPPTQGAATTNARPHTSIQPLGSLQVPWTVSIHPATNYVAIGQCLLVYIDLLDASGKDIPRNPIGQRVGMADFDWTATGNAAVGKYDGPNAWAVCACPAAAIGSTIHVMATYPSASLPDKAKMPGLAFQSYIELPITPPHGTNSPAGCDNVLVTTTVATAVPGGRPPTGGPPGQGPLMNPPAGGGSVATPTTPAPQGQTPYEGTPLPANLPPAQLAPAAGGAPSAAGITPAVTAPQVTRGTPPELSAPLPVAPGTAHSPIATPGAAPAPALVNPTGFTAVERGGGGVDWKWQAVPGAVKYRLDGTGLPSTGYFTTNTQNAYPHIPAGPGSWKVTAIYPGNLFDTTSGTPVSLVVHVLPVRSQHWITKNNGAGALAQVQVPANPFDPEHPCSPMTSSSKQTLNDCTQYDVNNHTVNQGVFPGDLSAAPFDPAAFAWMDATSVDNWVKNGFRRWLDVDMKLWFDQFQDQKEAVYGNPLDLGVGRRSFCAQEMKGPPHPGLKTVCYATAHGATPGTPGFNDSATITHPGPGHGADFILAMMIIKDATGTTFLVSSGGQWVVPTVRLDTEGPKFVPFACISCHGGTYNATTRKVDNSSLLPLDPGLLSFASASDKAAQEEKIRNINLIITRAQPNSAITSYLNGLYHGSIGALGTVAQPDYVPSGWTQQAGLYRSVVRPYCAMCHLAAPPSWNFTSWGNFLQNKELIYADVCAAHIMPHAEVPFKSFWTKDTGILYLPGLLAAAIGKPSC